MTSRTETGNPLQSPGDNLPKPDLNDGDILDAMRRIPGYLDINTEDFRSIYRLAHGHAVDRLFRRVRATSSGCCSTRIS